MIPQHITYQVGGTIYFYSRKKLTSPTVTVRNNRGGDILTAQSCTASTVSTYLSAAISPGDTSFSVASGTGITNGMELQIAPSDFPEECVVKSISGTTVTPWRPLIISHASGKAVQCTTVSYTVSAAQADELFWDGLAIWYDNGVYYAQTPIECTRYPLFRLATIQDVWDEYPQLRDLLSPNDDPNRLLKLAHNDVMTTIAAIDRARCFFASGTEIARAVVFQFLCNYYRHCAQENATILFDRYQMALADEIKKIVSILPRDADQDQVAQSYERMRANSIRISRA